MTPQWEAALKASAILTGAIWGWMNIVRPLIAWIKARLAVRDAARKAVYQRDEDFRNKLLDDLQAIRDMQGGLEDSLSLLQRDSIERSYCMFVLEHGYCPSGMKRAISDMFDSYNGRGYNHIARERVTQLLELPEFPKGGGKE